jgi:hypothetical protein
MSDLRFTRDHNGKLIAKLAIGGKMLAVNMNDKEAERLYRQQQAWEQKLSQERKKLRAKPKAHAIVGHLWKLNSTERTEVMIDILGGVDTPTFWRVLTGVWNACDDTWTFRRDLLSLLRRHAAVECSREYMSRTGRAFLDSVPRWIRVYRGCSASRVRGISWTTQPKAARGFARGHRLISVPEPVIATATIPKEAVFFVSTDRKEHEIILDPRSLSGICVEPFQVNRM